MEKMSGMFLEDGRELTSEEWERDKYFMSRGLLKMGKTKASLFWLGHKLRLPYNFDLARIIERLELEGSIDLYGEPRFISKPEGGTRIIITPKPELKLIQQRINTLLLDTFERNINTFGYRGGSCLDVAMRHQKWPSTLKLDVKDAFFQVGTARIMAAVKNPFYSEHYPELSGSGFSWTISKWISYLCTYFPIPSTIEKIMPGIQSFLPQGAPTSPICYDIACTKTDEKLQRIAERVGGIFSRYADNYFFSTKNSRISDKLEGIIVCTLQDGGFPIHKVRRIGRGELLRVLGYNILDGRITNTKRFRKKLRCALYVLRTRLERGLNWDKAYSVVKGHMGFAQNIPDSLRMEFEECERTINNY